MRVSLNVPPIVQYRDWDLFCSFGGLVVRATADAPLDTWFGDTEAVCAARHCGYITTDNGRVTGLPYDFKDTVFWFVVPEWDLRGCYPYDWERCKAAHPQFFAIVIGAVHTGNVRVGATRRPLFRVTDLAEYYNDNTSVLLSAYMWKKGLGREVLSQHGDPYTTMED